jgi:hypothetical protein
MRVSNLLNLTSQSGAATGTSFSPYAGLNDRVIRSNNGVAVFKIDSNNATVLLEGSLDGTNFVTVKSVSRVGSDVLEGHSVCIFPHMRGKVSSTTGAANIKLTIGFE